MSEFYSYPAVFREERDGEKVVFNVIFPDFPGCITCGETLEDSLQSARDALWTYLDWLLEDGEVLPAPTPEKAISTEADETIYLIQVDMESEDDWLIIHGEDGEEREAHTKLMKDEKRVLVPFFLGKDIPEGTIRNIENCTGIKLSEEE